MVKVAITGGPGSGKSAVRGCFEVLGAYAIDLDHLAREVVRPETTAFGAVVAYFGKEVVASDGTLDRRRLRKIIVGDLQSRRVLEKITHPEILRLLEARLAQIGARDKDALVVVEVPLLVEAGIQDAFDAVVLVQATPEVQKDRIMVRDGCSAVEAEGLLRLHPETAKKGLYAHYVVDNTGAIEKTRTAVSGIFKEIVSRFRNVQQSEKA
jgi:dephospho-CoA kinase